MSNQRLDVSYATWSDLVKAPERLELLLTVGKGYRRYFRNAESGFETLKRHRIDSYMVDFDVVAEIASVDGPDGVSEQTLRTRHSLYSWFRLAREQQKFYLPWGAYQELLNKILEYVKLQHGVNHVRERETDLTGRLALLEIGKVVGLDEDSLSGDDEYLASAITSHLNMATNKLKRLDEFLEPHTFDGVRAKLDQGIYDCFLRWVRACPRRKLNRSNEWIVTTNRQKDPRDQCDALNMAIALESVISSQGGDPRCALVTSTQFILDLTHPNEWLFGDLSEIPEDRQPDIDVRQRRQILEELHSILKTRGAQRCFACLPFIHPRQALCAELVGYFKNREIGRLRLREMRSQLGNLIAYINEYQELQYSEELEDGSSFLQTRMASIAKLIGKFTEKFNAEDDETMRKLEDLRATSLTLGKQIVRDEACNVSVGSDTDSIEAASTLFLFHVSSVRERAWSSVEYACTLDPVSGVHSRFRVRESVHDVIGETVLEGDVIKDPNDASKVAYAFRIRTYCFLGEFLNFIDTILEERSLSLAGEEFVTIESDLGVSAQQISIFCGREWLGIPLNIRSYSADSLTDKFKNALKHARVTRNLLGKDVLVPATVEQVRLILHNLEVSFDCELLECDLTRHVRCLSSSPNLSMLCRIVKNFHPRHVNSEKLSDALTKVLE